MTNNKINYFTEDKITLYNDVKVLCLKYLDRQIYDLDDRNIEEYKNKNNVDWRYLCECEKMSMYFMEEFIDKLDWDYVCKFQKLNENFMEKYIDKLHWKFICKCQKLSINFIEKHIDKLNTCSHWRIIYRYQNLNKNFRKKYAYKLY